MRSESLINNMMQPSPFSEFNPLDVLATAASLQSARIETDDEVSPINGSTETQGLAAENEADEEKDGDLKDVAQVSPGKPDGENVSANDTNANRDADTDAQDHKSPSDDSVFQVPAVKRVKLVNSIKGNSTAVNPSGNKPVTVLRAYKPQMSDHSYAFMFQLQSLKNDEDEGYSSRSSIDEEGEDISASHGTNLDSPDGMRSPTTPKQGKMSKIIVVGKDSSITEPIASPNSQSDSADKDSGGSETCGMSSATDTVDDATEINCEDSIQGCLTSFVQIAPENLTDMVEEHVNEMITLDPASVEDSLPPTADIEAGLSENSIDNVQEYAVDITDHDISGGSTTDTDTGDKREISGTEDTLNIAAEADTPYPTDDTESSMECDAAVGPVSGQSEDSCSADKKTDLEENVAVPSETDDKTESAVDSLKNQYIIEDDVSPVRKFGSTDTEPEIEAINVTHLSDRSEGTVLVVSKTENKNSVRQHVLKPTQSLLKTSNVIGKTNSSVVRVIPFVNGGRVAQILPRPLHCVTPVKGPNKTIMKVASPCIEVKKPTLGKLLMPVATNALTSNKGIILKSPVPSPTAAILSPALSTDTSLSGRSTPKSIPDTDSVDSDLSPTLKVTMLSSDSDQKEIVKVEKTSIGTVGSLSWKSFGGGLIQLGGNSRSQEFIRIQGSQIQPRDPVGEEPLKDDDLADASSLNPWAGTSLETASMDDVLSVTNSDDSLLSEPPVMSPIVPSPSHCKRRSKTDRIDPESRWERCSELHPLIDHDYCMFTEFNAQIQSSIIATTESKTRIDRRYNKKTKSARTKTASLSYEPDRPVRGRPSEKVLKGKKCRLKKKEAAMARGAFVEDNIDVEVKPAVHSKESEEKAIKRQLRQEKKLLAEKKKAERNERNYVKITGSYKDDFVYYATRNYRGRPRKAPEPYLDPAAKPFKPIPAGGVNDFDWYRDLSRADKTSYFSSPGLQSTESSRHASPAALPIRQSEDTMMDKHHSIPGSTPFHESDVVDLVCELSGIGGGDGYTASTSGGVEVSTTEETETTTNGDSSLDLNQMAEHVCSMLTSMDENELLLLEKLGEDSTDEKPAGSGLNDTSFDGFLGAPVQGPTQLCDDLDEINDNDLLTTDIGNMNDMSDILTDLRSSATSQTTTTVDGASVQAGTSNVTLATASTPSSFTSEKLDRAELFPDIHTPTLQNRNESTMVPELTVVSMFWNDLPGLMISGVQHVRLVDIHKQVLPAKDTGILKKRCQMLTLDVANCSDLQRDFLIRYANAAKSKSTVIVSKPAAEELIGFYVNPKPRVNRQAAEEKEEGRPKAGVSSPLPTEGSSVQSSDVCVTLDQAAPATPSSSSSSRIVDDNDAIPQSRSGKKSRKRKLTGDTDINPASPGPVINMATLDTPSASTTSPTQDVKRSERLRHKKVRYADMANGTAYLEGVDDDEDARQAPESPSLEGSTSSSKFSPSLLSAPVLETDDSGLSSDHENRDITLQKLVYPEELEIKKIRLKARKKKLTKQEKRRLKRLKERMQKKAMKQKMEKKRLRLLQRQKTSSGKGKRRLQETHAYTKKVNPEHCYAACPAVKDEVESHQMENNEEIEVREVKEELVKEPVKAPLAVIHRDNVHRQGTARVGRWQDGEVYLSIYRNKDSACIQCLTCHDFYTVRRFLKHMHKQSNPDELLEVNLPQKFELRNPSPTDGETKDWQEFQTRRRLVELSPNERNRKAITKPADLNTLSLSLEKDSLEKKVAEAKVEAEPMTTVDSGMLLQEPVTPVASEKAVKVEIHLKADPQESKIGSVLKVEQSPEENGLTRHSTRVRKRKQLHPIESYVYSKLLPTNGKPEMREELPGEIDKVSMSVTPVRATKFKVSVRKDGSSQVTRLDVKVPASDKRIAKRARYSQ